MEESTQNNKRKKVSNNKNSQSHKKTYNQNKSTKSNYKKNGKKYSNNSKKRVNNYHKKNKSNRSFNKDNVVQSNISSISKNIQDTTKTVKEEVKQEKKTSFTSEIPVSELTPVENNQKEMYLEKTSKPILKISSFWYMTILLLYLEIILKLITFKSLSGISYTLSFSIPFILILYLIINIFHEKGNKILCYLITIIFSTYYGFQCIFYRLFSNIFSFNTIALASDIGEFKSMIFTTITGNIITIILYLIPFILLIIFRNKIEFKRTKPNKIFLALIFCFIAYFINLATLYINKSDVYSAYNLYYNINSEIKNVEKFGLATTTRLDIKRIIFGFEEKLTSEKNPDNNNTSTPPNNPTLTPKFNKIEIDFTKLIAEEQNSTIKNILSYFQNSEPTNQNDYTGMFKDKNLIFILAEGFNTIAVNKELTPTLYKLTHEGFIFNNYYSPVFLSTTGGEFQATTGLIPTQETLSNWKKYQPTIKYALGNSFANIGYKTQSYHNWTYTYYKRNNTMPTLGFENYLGCGNGLEELISCEWLPSDLDMINKTLPFYQNQEKFATYYVSVSGHAPYVYNSNGNSIALKNKDAVADLPYSDNVKAYLATQIEFDKALEALIKSLEQAGILDDTVISFVGDHYPYTLTLNEINELSTYERDEVIEVNRSNFVIWNNKMTKPIIIDKVGSQIDVLPTLLNLFGIEYDSRLIVGKDILSESPGLAIFSDRSWVSDYGVYRSGHFSLKDNKSLPNELEYIESINNIVSNRFTISNQIIKYKIYDYLFK